MEEVNASKRIPRVSVGWFGPGTNRKPASGLGWLVYAGCHVRVLGKGERRERWGMGGAEGRREISISEQLLRRKAKRFRGVLVCKAHRLVYHSTQGLREIQKKAEGRAAPLGEVTSKSPMGSVLMYGIPGGWLGTCSPPVTWNCLGLRVEWRGGGDREQRAGALVQAHPHAGCEPLNSLAKGENGDWVSSVRRSTKQPSKRGVRGLGE